MSFTINSDGETCVKSSPPPPNETAFGVSNAYTVYFDVKYLIGFMPSTKGTDQEMKFKKAIKRTIAYQFQSRKTGNVIFWVSCVQYLKSNCEKKLNSPNQARIR